MITAFARLVWAAVVMGARWGLANGLWLSTYFERTEQARIDDARGEVWMWAATLVLAVAALIARWRWRTRAWSGALLVAAGVQPAVLGRGLPPVPGTPGGRADASALGRSDPGAPTDPRSRTRLAPAGVDPVASTPSLVSTGRGVSRRRRCSTVRTRRWGCCRRATRAGRSGPASRGCGRSSGLRTGVPRGWDGRRPC
jgi:hypothetical protein